MLAAAKQLAPALLTALDGASVTFDLPCGPVCGSFSVKFSVLS
jgi:hypothetical protein